MQDFILNSFSFGYYYFWAQFSLTRFLKFPTALLIVEAVAISTVGGFKLI